MSVNSAKRPSATDLLRSLSPDEIRRRLVELDAEERALRTLLRAAIRFGLSDERLAQEGERA